MYIYIYVIIYVYIYMYNNNIRLLHKTMRYQHHRQNYKESMRTGIVPKGLRIKKAPAFEPSVKILTSGGTKFYTMRKKTSSSFYCMNRQKSWLN